MDFATIMAMMNPNPDKLYKFTAIRNAAGKSFLIDSCYTMDHGNELMIFEMNGDYEEADEKAYGVRHIADSKIKYKNEDVDWCDVYGKRYATIEEAEVDFDRIIDNFVDFYVDKFWNSQFF